MLTLFTQPLTALAAVSWLGVVTLADTDLCARAAGHTAGLPVMPHSPASINLHTQTAHPTYGIDDFKNYPGFASTMMAQIISLSRRCVSGKAVAHMLILYTPYLKLLFTQYTLIIFPLC